MRASNGKELRQRQNSCGSRRHRATRLLVVGTLVVTLGGLASEAAHDFDDVGKGIDLWMTPAGNTSFDLTTPGGFFGTGSAAFSETIDFQGVPYGGLFGPTDTIVERLDIADFALFNAPLDCEGSCSEADVRIIIRALQLESVDPIVVTINNVATLWDVKVCLSSVVPQQEGLMTLFHACPDGGTFESTLPVKAKMIFSPQAGGADVVLDPIDDELSAVGGWVHADIVHPGFGVIQVPAGLQVDGDCDGMLDPALPGSTPVVCEGAVLGITLTPCECDTPPGVTPGVPVPGGSHQSKKLTVETGLSALHGVLTAELPPAPEDCCCPDGSCTPNVNAGACAVMGCSTMVEGTCNMPDEACCLIDAQGNPTCVDTSPACCERQGGTPRGPGTACGAKEACCWLFLFCDDLDPECCTIFGGVPQGPGSMCQGDNIPRNGIDDECEHPCGNNVIDPPEQCDGIAAPACPGMCKADCTCPGAPPPCGNGKRDPGEECDGNDDKLCPGNCRPNCVCGLTIGACFRADGCVDVSQDQCDESGFGTWGGANGTCGDAPGCCFGDGSCQDLAKVSCALAGGIHHPGMPCAGEDTDKNGVDDTCDTVPVPAISEWGLAALTILVLAAGTIVLRRRVARGAV